jgi:hypothetical protein
MSVEGTAMNTHMRKIPAVMLLAPLLGSAAGAGAAETGTLITGISVNQEGVSLQWEQNKISDLTGLVQNAAAWGLGTGNTVRLDDNPLSDFAKTNQIPILIDTYGVSVSWTP